MNCQHRSSFESALNRWTLTNQSRSSDTLKFNTYIHISIIGERYLTNHASDLLIDCGAVDQSVMVNCWRNQPKRLSPFSIPIKYNKRKASHDWIKILDIPGSWSHRGQQRTLWWLVGVQVGHWEPMATHTEPQPQVDPQMATPGSTPAHRTHTSIACA